MKLTRNAPCSCGSGKRYKDCCGHLSASISPPLSEAAELLPLLQRGEFAELQRRAREVLARRAQDGPVWQLLTVALQRQGLAALQAAEQAALHLPNDAVAQLTMGNELARSGRRPEACAAFARALAVRPDFPEALANLGEVHYELGQDQQAADSCERALLSRPELVQAHHTRAKALLRLHRLEEAVSHFRTAISIDPGCVDAYMDLAIALRGIGRLVEAAAALRAVLDRQPDSAAAHAEIASVYRLQRRLLECDQHCERALGIESNSVAAMTVRAELRADQGEFDQAESLHRRVLDVQPDRIESLAALVHLRRMSIQDNDWIETARLLLQRSWPPHRERVLQYALGKYFDDLGQFDTAFTHFKRANALSGQCGPPYDAASLDRIVARIIRHQGRAWMQARRTSQLSERPVFIVGMPRSGTTLAEQMLAAHHSVFGAGELSFWAARCATDYASDDDSHSLRQFDAERTAGLAVAYLSQLEALSPDAERVVDKFPANFFFLGLIHAALPQARFIHMSRDPRDTGLSIYFQQFEPANTYANDLGHISHYYRSYLRLMANWRAILPHSTLLEVPYAQLVEQPEEWSRRMLRFIQLPWNAGCLDFQRASPSVVTASRWQVRQGIIKSSVDRWRHYEHHLGPLADLPQQ